MKLSTLATLLLWLVMPHRAYAQQTLPIPDDGWRVWLDRSARWETDSLYLPDEVNIEKLPNNPPTGGWSVLNSNAGMIVHLPTTVEEHFWGATGERSYSGEYYFENQDTAVRNGNYRGVSWWWRDIEVPASFAGKHATLYVRGARLRAEVFWNSHLVGYHIITETSFTCDVGAVIRPGETNRLAIRITNPGGRLDWLDTELMSWGNQRFHKSHGFSGLDRGMVIRASNSLFIKDLWVLNNPDARQIAVHGNLQNILGRAIDARMRMQILDPARSNRICEEREVPVHINASGLTPFRGELRFDDAQLWSEKTPHLYMLRATLSYPRKLEAAGKGGFLTDSTNVMFGFRWFEADGIGTNAVLRLNGDRIRLVSAISWGFWARNGLWPTRELAEREVRAAKALGLNCIQFHRNVGKAEVFDAQDRLGLYRYMEPGGGQTSLGETFSLYAPSPTTKIDDSGRDSDAVTFAERYMEEKIVGMVRDHRGHPSLLLYCIQNEIHPDLRNPRIFHILRRVHQEDPSRIVVLKSGFPENRPINEAWMEPYSDVVHHDTGTGYSGWWDAHTVGGPGVWRDEMYRNPGDFTHRSTNDSEIVMWGEMLGAAVPDNHEMMVRTLVTNGGSSYDLGDHREVLAAYNAFLDRWGFRGAFPTAGSLFTSIGNKSYDFWGRVIETARLAEANDYFVISGWESTAIENHSGLVDNLRGFKGDPRLLGRRLEPVRVVVRSSSMVVPRGARAALDFTLLNETTAGVGREVHVWMQSPSNEEFELGRYVIPAYTQDRFVYPLAVHVLTPPLTREGTYLVRARIDGKERPMFTEELFAVDSVGRGRTPSSIAILSGKPELRGRITLFPGITAAPYDDRKQYDLLIAADNFANPPSARVEPGRRILKTDDQELYRSAHYGGPENFDYLFSGLPAGTAKVILRFAEIFQNAPGVRVFDVAINGDTVLKQFDVFKAAGGKDIAFDTVFSVSAPDGIVRITVPRVEAGSARFCAIGIEAADSVISINCGGDLYTDRRGRRWIPYSPPLHLGARVLERVRNGTPLLVLAEGEIASREYAARLAEEGSFTMKGEVGEARASWMGSWYFVRKHPLFEGLQVDCGMGSFYQVPVQNADGVMIDGSRIEVIAGYGRDHDRNIGAGAFTARLGKGRIVFLTIPGLISAMTGGSTGMQPVIAKRLIANSMRWLTAQDR